MKREIVQTLDGSTTIYLPEWNENYHSKHGAIQEAKHVFIKNGFEQFNQPEISILEIGLGTGLNALITFNESLNKHQLISYTGVEAFPIDFDNLSNDGLSTFSTLMRDGFTGSPTLPFFLFP